ncbi:hypothetical protein C8T65DRAFT_749685 [Cerioporus squamosus]|nr:hypothetical protein C8T65DRAFT_749685 [Cerioporus squamosus]
MDCDPASDDMWKDNNKLMPEEVEEKSRVVATIEKQLKSSIWNLDNAWVRREDNPWVPLFSSLRRISKSTAPRKLADWQLYMNSKPDEIDKVFALRWASAGLEQKDNLTF